MPFYDLIIWAKAPPNGTAWGNYPTTPRIRANHEWLLVNRSEGPGRGVSDISWADWSRWTQSVWTINPKLPYREVHPATFPAELVARFLLLFTAPEACILDPWMGVGTTLTTAKRLRRTAIGIELSEAYCEVAAQRLSQDVLPLEVA